MFVYFQTGSYLNMTNWGEIFKNLMKVKMFLQEQLISQPFVSFSFCCKGRKEYQEMIMKSLSVAPHSYCPQHSHFHPLYLNFF